MNRYRWRDLDACRCCDLGSRYLEFRERRYGLKADVVEQIDEREPESDRAFAILLDAEFEADELFS